ncbi:MAG: VWA domain-containing protein [Pyrinomonadaceae bacterium]|nr:VWA domain-containing protein [Pyrinomonadaceae bacterium]
MSISFRNVASGFVSIFLVRVPHLNTFLILLSCLLAFASSIVAQVVDDAPIKVNTVLVNIPVIVSDKDGRNISGLKKDNFSIFQDGKRQTIEFFADSDSPMKVAIAIDTSASTIPVLDEIKEAALKFVSLLGPEDQGMIVTFDNDVKIRQRLTSDKKQLRKGISGTSTVMGGAARMNQAIDRIVTTEFAGLSGRKAVIVLTDAGEINPLTKKRLLDTLIESDTIVYPIFYYTIITKEWEPGVTFLEPIKIKENITLDELVKIPPIDYLNSLAIVTGGRFYAAGASNFRGAFQSIADELKKQYTIGFYPDSAENGSNNIKIGIDRKDAVVRSKRTIRLKPRNTDVPKSSN